MDRNRLHVTQHTDGFTYYAFISYKREDEAWARWLQKELETYRLPSVLQRQDHRLPRRIFPVFRDKTDLSSGTVRGALHRELEASRHLVVICSPRSAVSEYVDYEIRSFLEMNRAEAIIPFIIDGTVQAEDTSQECFPPSLLTLGEMPLGIDVRETGRQDALLKVVAALLGLRFDELKRRDAIRAKRRRGIISMLCLILLTLGVFLADYLIPKTSRFQDYALRWGVPEGIGPLTRKQVQGMYSHYEVTTSRRKVRRVACVNAEGSPVMPLLAEYNDRPAIADYAYASDGKIAKVEYLGTNGQRQMTMLYSPTGQYIDFIRSDDTALNLPANSATESGGFFGLYSTGSPAGNISRHRIEYDEKGYVIGIEYLRDSTDAPASDANGFGGVRYKRYHNGLPLRTIYLARNKATGVWLERESRAYEYDHQWRMTCIERYGAMGVLAENANGEIITCLDWDEDGHLLAERLTDGNGISRVAYKGHATVHFGYDPAGHITTIHYSDGNGQPVLTAEGYAALRQSHDREGRICSVEYLGIDGHPMLLDTGIAGWSQTWDGSGNVTAMDYRGLSGERILNQEGIAGWEASCRNGNIEQMRLKGLDGEPTLCRNGYAGWDANYGETGLLLAKTFLGTDGQPILLPQGFSGIRLQYDKTGHLSRCDAVGTDTAPIELPQGLWSRILKYDQFGNCILEEYRDLEGLPVLVQARFARRTAVYDSNGNPLEEAFYDADGRLMQSGGYARCVSRFDADSNCLSRAFFGADGLPMLCTDGFASFERTYDTFGLCLRDAYFGVHGEPVVCSLGFSEARTKTDDQGRVLETAYYGRSGEPVLGPGGCARVTFAFDDLGVAREICHYDSDGHLIVANSGYARRILLMDGRGNVEQAYFGADGLPMIGPEGYARLISSTDFDAETFTTARYDAQGAPLSD